MLWTRLLRHWKLVGASVVSVLISVLAAYTVSFSSQIADLNRELGRIEGTLAASQRIEDMAIDCGERTARIEGYLDAIHLLAELESGQQVIDVIEEFRQQMDSP